VRFFQTTAFWMALAGAGCLAGTWWVWLRDEPGERPVVGRLLQAELPRETSPEPAPSEIQPTGVDRSAWIERLPLREPLVDVEKAHPLPALPTEAEYLARPEAFPAGSIPPRVRLRQPVRLDLVDTAGRVVGSVQVPAGTEVAIDRVLPGKLRVRHGSNAGEIAMGATDFGDRVYGPHRVQVEREIERIRGLRKAAEARNRETLADREQRLEALGAPPERAADGAYPALIARLDAEGGPQVEARDVSAWGEVQHRAVDGVDYWAVELKYHHATALGILQDQRIALWRGGEFARWIRGR